MTATEIKYGAEARQAMLRGMRILANAVKATLGPKGRNVLIERPFGAPQMTKDGVTVAKSIELPDRFENVGALLLREIATRVSEEAGDGTTTAITFAEGIVSEGVKAAAAGMNPMDLKRGIDLAVDAAVADLARRARRIQSHREIAQIATISANNDQEVGEIIAEAVDRVGREGAITIEDSNSLETELDVVEGLQFDHGYLSPHFVTDLATMSVEFEDAEILLLEEKLSNLQAMLPLMQSRVEQARPLLIVAEDVEGEALATLVVNKLRGTLKVAAVKAPGFGDRRKEMLTDLAVLTGGQVVSEDLGIKLESVTPDMLGSARLIKLNKDETTIVDGGGDKGELEARGAQIREQIKQTTSDYDRDKLNERLAKLAGGVAVIKVGGATEFEISERKDRVDDALNATRAAIEEGIVPGGGTAILYATKAVAGLRLNDPDQQTGVGIVQRALQWPVRQIAENAGIDGAVVVNNLLEQDDPNWGFDAQTLEYRDMVKAGIIDPCKVVRIVLQNAASIAGLLVTTEAMVAENRQKNSPAGAQASVA